MTETDHIPKRVSKGLFSPIEFTFYSPFTFEECLYLVENNIRSSTGPARTVDVTIEKADHNSANIYLAKYSTRDTKIAQIEAHLEVWQGTSTLIIGKARFFWRISWVFMALLQLGILFAFAVHGIVVLNTFNLLLPFACFLGIHTIVTLSFATQHSRLLDDLEDAVAIHSIKEKRGKKLK